MAESARVGDRGVSDLGVGERCAAHHPPVSVGELGQRAAVRKVSTVAQLAEQPAHVGVREGIVVVKRRDHSSSGLLEQTVDRVGAGGLPEGLPASGIVRALRQLEVAHAPVSNRADGLARVRLRSVAADKHLDVAPILMQRRSDRPVDQSRRLPPSRNPDRHQGVPREVDPPALEDVALRLPTQSIDEALGPPRLGDDGRRIFGRSGQPETELLGEIVKAKHPLRARRGLRSVLKQPHRGESPAPSEYLTRRLDDRAKDLAADVGLPRIEVEGDGTVRRDRGDIGAQHRQPAERVRPRGGSEHQRLPGAGGCRDGVRTLRHHRRLGKIPRAVFVARDLTVAA